MTRTIFLALMVAILVTAQFGSTASKAQDFDLTFQFNSAPDLDEPLAGIFGVADAGVANEVPFVEAADGFLEALRSETSGWDVMLRGADAGLTSAEVGGSSPILNDVIRWIGTGSAGVEIEQFYSPEPMWSPAERWDHTSLASSGFLIHDPNVFSGRLLGTQEAQYQRWTSQQFAPIEENRAVLDALINSGLVHAEASTWDAQVAKFSCVSRAYDEPVSLDNSVIWKMPNLNRFGGDLAVLQPQELTLQNFADHDASDFFSENLADHVLQSCCSTCACGPSAPPVPSPGTLGHRGGSDCWKTAGYLARLSSAGGNGKAEKPVANDWLMKWLIEQQEKPDIPLSFANQMEPLSFPSTVALQYEGNDVKCSGVLASEAHILTAAHCVCNDQPLNAFFGDTPFFAAAMAATSGLRSTVALSDDYKFYSAAFCTEFNDPQRTTFPEGDLVSIALKDRLPFAVRASILPLEPLSELKNDGKVYVAGFGLSWENAKVTGRKSYAEVVFQERTCDGNNANSNAAEHICHADTESITVSPDENNADSCYGDSGGPIVVFGAKDGVPRLAGIVSRTLRKDREDSCGSGGINISLEAPKIRDWVKSAVNRKDVR